MKQAALRTSALTLLFIIIQVVVTARPSNPLGWSEVRRWQALVKPAGNELLVQKSQPAWQSTDAPLALVGIDGSVRGSGLQGEDVRDALWVERNVVAVCVRDGAPLLMILDSTLHVKHVLPFPFDLPVTTTFQVQLLATDKKHVYVNVLGIVCGVDITAEQPQVRLVEQRVFGMGKGTQAWSVVIVHDVGGLAYASLIDTLLQRRIAPSVPLASRATVGLADGKVIVISPVDSNRTTQVSLIALQNNDVQTISVQAGFEQMTWFTVNTAIALAIADRVQGGYILRSRLLGTSLPANDVDVFLPPERGIPRMVTAQGDTVFVVYHNGIVSVHNGRILSDDDAVVPDGPIISVHQINDALLVTTRTGSVLFQRSIHTFWWLWDVLEKTGSFVVPGSLLVVILLLWLRLRRQRRFLDAMLELPGAGLVFVMDDVGRLLRTNERTAQLLRITSKVPMRRLFRSYMRHSGVREIQDFLSKALVVRRPLSQKIRVDDDDEQREYMFTAQPLWGSFGKLRGMVVTGIDITETLERRRLVNWAQLAHDMQTNLSTIRLNAEQLQAEQEGRQSEKVRRILYQTEVLIQRVRDLVSVGRTEDLQRAPVHSAEFCTQLRHEFDPTMFPHVHFVMKLKGTMMSVDKLKLSRAVRNAVENAIKSLRGNEGTVEIATWYDRWNVYIRVSDTGVGMDTLTLENMMKPYFTTAKDGSGTGIGTMIMQHVTHLHGGSLRVTSEPGAGTQVVFRIPLTEPLEAHE